MSYTGEHEIIRILDKISDSLEGIKEQLEKVNEPMIAETPKESIPIPWITRWSINEMARLEGTNLNLSTTKMIEDWRKENEIN